MIERLDANATRPARIVVAAGQYVVLLVYRATDTDMLELSASEALELAGQLRECAGLVEETQ